MRYFINPNGKRPAKKKKAVPAWVRARGFSNWTDYFASIRPGGRVRRKSAATLTKRKRRRKVSAIRSASDPARSRQTSEKGTMAKRARKRRRKASTSAAPRRKRRRIRRNPGAFARLRSNPRKRRRRRSVALATRTRRRRFRRNPGLGGVVGTIVQGLKDGAAVVGGQVAARKIRGAVTGMLPADMQAKVRTGVGHIALSIASAVTVSLVTRRFLPGYAKMLAAGAFSEAINAALAQTPVAPFLGAFPARRVVSGSVNSNRGRGVNAWPGANALPPAAPRGVSAWPRQVGMPTMVQV